MWVWLGWRGCGYVQNDIIGWLHGEGGSHLWTDHCYNKWVNISFTDDHTCRLIYASYFAVSKDKYNII